MTSPDCEKIYVGKKAGAHSTSQDEIIALLVRLGLEGKRVVRLKGGDVFVFGRGGEEAAELRAAGVSFEVVPGITSALAVPAYAGIPVTHRDRNTSFTIATGHEDPVKGYSSLDYAKLANPSQTLILLMAMGNLAGIVAKLRENGLPGDMPVAVVRDGTRPTQATLIATLATVVDDVDRARFAPPAVVVIGNVVREREFIRWFDTSPLFGKRVLITRARADSDAFAERLLEIGAAPVVAPTIAIGPPDEPEPARQAARTLASRSWVVFTSRNGVDACFDLLGEAGGDARRFGSAKVAAIGPKTAGRLSNFGIRPDFVPEVFVAEDVAAGLLERTVPGDRVLVFGAQEMRDALPRALRAAGRDVEVIAAYKTSNVDDPSLARAAEETDVWTFTSASTVLGFVANVPGAGDLAQERTVACIGPVTAEAARAAGLPPDVVAEHYTVTGLIEALEAFAIAR
jgi:uroporphyrinogen III methyltransferase/synthase